MERSCRAGRAGRTEAGAALGAVLVAMLSFTGAWAPGAAGEGGEGGEAALLAAWAEALDRDGNRLHDALDADLAQGAAGEVLVHVLYARRPTPEDAARLHDELGAAATHVFARWDVVKARLPYAALPGLAQLPGVAGVEKFDPPMPDLDVSRAAIRAEDAAGVPVVSGIDHGLGVHEDLGLRGEGIVIAVLDTGVDNAHEALDDLDDDRATHDPKLVQRPGGPLGTLVAGMDASTGFAVLGCVDPPDDHKHGTHTASTALGTGGPSGRYRGVAPQARLVDVDIALPSGSGLGMDLAFEWVLDFNDGATCYGDPGPDRIDVATMSFASGGDYPFSTLNRMINDVVRGGVVFVQSAGNGGNKERTLTAGAEGAILVGNTNDYGTIVRSDDKLYTSSSRGPRYGDPDTDRLDELRPDLAAPGTAIMAAKFHESTKYTAMTGTSMAAPHVAGAAALMLQANPALRPVDTGDWYRMGDAGAVPVRDLLQQTAQYKTFTEGLAAQRSQAGRFGLSWNNAWGYGLLDAYAAVARAQQDAAGLAAAASEPRPTYGAAFAPAEADRLTEMAFGTDPGAGLVAWRWDFGDGATSTEPAPRHRYATLGEHPVHLLATDAAGATEAIEVGWARVANVPPRAAIEGPAVADRVHPAAFRDASTDPDGAPAAWRWDFGGGAASTAREAAHTFPRLGRHTVALEVVDNDGAAARATHEVEVRNLAPEAAFAAPPEADRVRAVAFEDRSRDPEGPLSAWLWDFGDGVTSTDPSPSHRYGALGTYTVTLTVTDADGAAARASALVTVVNLPPRPAFATDPAHPMVLAPTTFLDGSTDEDGSVVAWAWDLGDGTTSAEREPVHVYLQGGLLQVALSVRDHEGGAARVVRTVAVCQPGPDASALLEPGHLHVEAELCLTA